MNVQLNPDLARFIRDQVLAGRYDSPDEAINAAVARLQSDDELLSRDLDDRDVAAIEEGLGQARCGEGRPWAEVREEIRTRYLNK